MCVHVCTCVCVCEEVSVTDRARTAKELLVKEAIHIRLNHPSLNRCWMAALKNTATGVCGCMNYDKSNKSVHSSPNTCICNSQLTVMYSHSWVWTNTKQYQTHKSSNYRLCVQNSDSYITLQGDFNMYTYIQELVLGCRSFERLWSNRLYDPEWGKQRLIDDIIVHTSCDMSCDVNWPMNVGDTHSISSCSGVTYVHSYCLWTASLHTHHIVPCCGCFAVV